MKTIVVKKKNGKVIKEFSFDDRDEATLFVTENNFWTKLQGFRYEVLDIKKDD